MAIIKNPTIQCPINFNNINATDSDVLYGKTYAGSDRRIHTGTIETYNGATDITPDNTIQTLYTNGKYMNSDIVIQPSTGGGVSLQIEYGNSAPSDTSKLWIKTSEPSEIEVNSNVETSVPNELQNISSLLTGLQSATCARVSNKIYIFGGMTNSSTYTNMIQIFNIDTKQVTQSNVTLPYAMYGMTCQAVGTKIYLFGGYSPNQGSYGYLNIIQVYDTENDIINTLNTTIHATFSFASIGSAVVGNKIYLFGGTRPSGPYNTSSVSYIWEFNASTETIQQLTTALPTASSGIICSAVDTKIYLFGGSNSTIYEFNTTNNTIRTLSITLPSAYSLCPCGTIGLNVYLFLGQNLYLFNSVNETLTLLNSQLSYNYWYTCSAVKDMQIFLFGTRSYGSNITLYTISLTLTENKMLLLYDIFAKFNIINTDTIKVKINPIDCYKGDSNNIGQQVKIALYDETQQNWVEVN